MVRHSLPVDALIQTRTIHVWVSQDSGLGLLAVCNILYMAGNHGLCLVQWPLFKDYSSPACTWMCTSAMAMLHQLSIPHTLIVPSMGRARVILG